MNAQKNLIEQHLKQTLPAPQYTAFCAVRAVLGSVGYAHTPSGLIVVRSEGRHFYINPKGDVMTPDQLRETFKASVPAGT
jgi:hypothetical protein